jgi:hypothetical protein
MSPRSKRLRDEMIAFLDREYRAPEDENMRGPLAGNLSYDDGKCRIGFNYSPSEFGHYHMWALLAWAARKVGRRRRFHDAASGLLVTAPYVMYDGVDCYPVVAERPRGAEDWQIWRGPLYVCDEYGTSTDPERACGRPEYAEGQTWFGKIIDATEALFLNALRSEGTRKVTAVKAAIRDDVIRAGQAQGEKRAWLLI